MTERPIFLGEPLPFPLARRHRRDWPQGLARIGLTLLLLALAFGFLGGAGYLIFAEASPLPLWVALIVLFPAVVAGGEAARAALESLQRSMRILAPDGAARLQKLDRPPVLLLRGFRDDALIASRNAATDIYTDRLEPRLVSALSEVGSVLAIGRPKEDLPEVGALRIYVHEWQRAVAFFMHRAPLVVLIVSDTDNLRLEVETAARIVPPERLLFIIPEPQDIQVRHTEELRRIFLRLRRIEPAPVERAVAGRSARYEALKRMLRDAPALRLPPELGDGRLLVFDADGRGRFLENRYSIQGRGRSSSPLSWLTAPTRPPSDGILGHMIELSLTDTLAPMIEGWRKPRVALPPRQWETG